MPKTPTNLRQVRNIRSGLTKLFLLFILIPLGLLTKVYSGFEDELVTNYFGGVIYVVFFILLTSLIFPQISSLKLSFIILCIVCLLEFSQLIQISFLNSLRKYFIIRTLIGKVFNVSDFVSYFIGALIGYGILISLKIKKQKSEKNFLK
jgi:hypothetical protein